MSKQRAIIIEWTNLPSDVKDGVSDYFAGTDRSIPNDSYHPFPPSFDSVKEAMRELHEDCGETYLKTLNWFYYNVSGKDETTIIHFDW